MKKLLLFALLLCVVLQAGAATWTDSNGISWSFNVNGTNAESIVPSFRSSISGNVVIPGTVYDGQTALTVTSIGSYAFHDCSGLTSVTIPEGVTSIGETAFYNCTGLTSVTIPEGVTSIGYAAFRGCTGLTSVTIPSSVTSIGAGAFYKCTGLTKVIVPDIAAWLNIYFEADNIYSISNPLQYAHHLYSDENTEITNLIIPEGVTSIGSYAFSGCSGLTSVTIPPSVTGIGERAFSSCTGLTSVTIPSSVTSIGERAFWQCIGLTSVTIPEGVTSIGESAFSACTGLTSVTIPNSVGLIRKWTFSSCFSLSTVFIGSGIKTIESAAFADCTNLNDVYCLAYKYPTTNKDAFQNSYPDYITLHVPDEAVEQYRAVEPWSTFKAVVGLKGSTGATPCAKPTIGFKNGQITTDTETDGAQCVTIITVDDAKTYTTETINLSVTYNISVYAVKPGYANSEIATATLCWIDVEPQTEGITNAVANVNATPVLIQSDNGRIYITGANDGTQVAVYDVSGRQVGSAITYQNEASIFTNLHPGDIAIVKIGDRSIKVVMR